MINEEDELNDAGFENELMKRAVRHSDKLNYKILIQLRIQACLQSIGKTNFFANVDSLKSSVFFDIPGLCLKREISVKEKELRATLMNRVNAILDDVNISGHPLKKDIYLLGPVNEYYFDLMSFLIQMLAQHRALIDAKDFSEIGEE